MADFAAAVETSLSPGLKDYPVVIASTGTPRARVYDMSDPAFREGIRKGMDLARARRVVPGIKILAPRFNQYDRAMTQLVRKALAYTPRVEPGPGDGHLFLDVTGTSRLFGPPVDVAFRLKKSFKKDLRLDPIWALATSKTVAKVATRLVKPLGEYIVAPGEEADFLEPLPLSLIPGLGPDELTTLTGFNLSRVSQLLCLSLSQLETPFPESFRQIYGLIRGIDPDPVLPPGSLRTQSLIRADHEFDPDTNQCLDLRAALYTLVEEICTVLRRQARAARSAAITLSHSDGIRRRAAGKLVSTVEPSMFKTCDKILARAWTRRVRVRHMELACETVPAQPVQGSLFTENSGPDRQERLAEALDRIRSRFGPGIVRTGLTFDRSGPAVRRKAEGVQVEGV